MKEFLRTFVGVMIIGLGLGALLALLTGCHSSRERYVDFVKLPCEAPWRVVSVIARADTATVVTICVKS